MNTTNIPDYLFKTFLFELDMYDKHLLYIFERLDSLDNLIKTEFDKIQDNYDPNFDDEIDVWNKSTEKVLGNSMTFIPEFQKVGAIAGYCIIIFHLFERFLEDIAYFKNAQRLDSYCQFITAYPIFKENTDIYKKIDELRLVVNYCKHDKGSAEQDLRKKRPDYFNQFSIQSETTALKPLSGYDIAISQNDFNEYISNIKAFVNIIKLQWG